MTGQPLWNPAWGSDKARFIRDKANRSDISGLGVGHVRDNFLDPG
jgi:hypothetical protein